MKALFNKQLRTFRETSGHCPTISNEPAPGNPAGAYSYPLLDSSAVKRACHETHLTGLRWELTRALREGFYHQVRVTRKQACLSSVLRSWDPRPGRPAPHSGDRQPSLHTGGGGRGAAGQLMEGLDPWGRGWAGPSGSPWKGRACGGGHGAGQLLAIPGGPCCNELGLAAQAEMLI